MTDPGNIRKKVHNRKIVTERMIAIKTNVCGGGGGGYLGTILSSTADRNMGY